MRNISSKPESGNNSTQLCNAFRKQGTPRDIIATRLTSVAFPLGMFSLLTGLFWIGDHGYYSKLFYWLLALPALLLISSSPKDVSALLRSRIFLAYLPFACYMAATILWSTGDDSAIDLVKRPLFVTLLFFAVFEFGRRRFDLFETTVKWSAVCAVLAAVFAIGSFFIGGGEGRLGGYGALRNPLLVSHVFGFFAALWAGLYFSHRKLVEPLALSSILVLMVLLLATGSRTPIVATVVTIMWLSALVAGRKSVVAMGVLAVIGVLIWLKAPEMITQRGLSYRTEIWADVGRQIYERLWFGHGFSTPLAVWVEELRMTFSDPHNLTLSVLYAGGLVGGGVWLLMYVVALMEAWHWRRDKWVLAFSATVIYGVSAGMTEGGAFLSRPKEHWFLIWIPMALLSLATLRARADERAI